MGRDQRRAGAVQVRHGVDREHEIERGVQERRQVAPRGLEQRYVGQPGAARPRGLDHPGRDVDALIGDFGCERLRRGNGSRSRYPGSPLGPEHAEPIEQLHDLERRHLQ